MRKVLFEEVAEPGVRLGPPRARVDKEPEPDGLPNRLECPPTGVEG
jgi:hypothetical protein